MKMAVFTGNTEPCMHAAQRSPGWPLHSTEALATSCLLTLSAKRHVALSQN